MASHKLYFATGNLDKLREVRNIMGPSFDIIGLQVDLPEIQGDIEEITKHKCESAFKKYGTHVIIEDTALCINALNGLPGPYIKSFMEKMGNEKLAELVNKYDDKSAQAVCTYGLMEDLDSDPIIIQGIINGKIVNESEFKSDKNFGWDSIFMPDGYDKTFAQMSIEEKNKISHRYIATNKLRDYIVNSKN